ncbi:MAG: hypothetical protein J5919_07750 [Clostridia bacterium]|nr:hypothetical protein [Clostridia bacterium]
MANTNPIKKRSLRRQLTAEKLGEMLREIEVDAAGKVGDGEYTARARITALFDRGSFAETGRFINRSSDPDEASGVITGYGSVGGRLVFAFAEDRSRMKGACDSAGGKKIRLLIETAVRNGSPVVGIFDSDGISVTEGISALSALGEVASASAAAAGEVPRIALIPGVCGATSAAIAASFDFVLSLRRKDGSGTDLFAAPPFQSGELINPAVSGISCFEASSEPELYETAQKLISLIPQNSSEGCSISDHDPSEENRSPDLGGLTGRALCEAVSDAGASLPLFAASSEGLAIAAAPLGGVGCMIAAGDRTVSDGALTRGAAEALAKTAAFADAFGMPLVLLTDCPGIDVSDGSPEYLNSLAELSKVMASSTNPRVTAFVGRAYGAGFVLLGSRSSGSDAVFALPDSAISAMSPESSVAFLWNEKVRANDLSSSREMLEREWREKYSSPVEAAIAGEVDDILPADALRPRIISAVYMLIGKSRTGRGRRSRK